MISNMTLILVLMTVLAFVLVMCDEVAGGHGGRMACSAAVGGFDGVVFGRKALRCETARNACSECNSQFKHSIMAPSHSTF